MTDDSIKPPRRSSRAWPILWIVAYGALLFTGILAHEPWRDEADNWLAARDLGLGALFDFTRYVGSPALWFLVQMPFAKLGAPYELQGLLHGSGMFLAGILLLRFAPWPLFLRLAVLFSYYPLYEYGVISRAYGLSVLLLFSAAAFHHQRHARPLLYAVLLALLSQTAVHAAVLAAVLGATFLVETLRKTGFRQGLPVLLVLGASALLLVWQLRPPLDGQVLAQPSRSSLSAFLVLAQNALVPAVLLPKDWASLATVANVGMLVLVIGTIRKDRRTVGVLFASILLLVLLLTQVYYGGLRHAGFLYLATVYALWVGFPGVDTVPRRTAVWLCVPLAASCLVGLTTLVKEYRLPFSASREMAFYIVQHTEPDQVIAAFPDPPASAVLPYLEQKQLWYAGRGAFGSHMEWNRQHSENRKMPYGQALARVEQRFAGEPGILVLLNRRIDDPAALGYALLYETQGRVFRARDEQYWLYRRE